MALHEPILELLRQGGTLEARVLASTVIVIVAVILGRYAVPRGLRLGRRVFADRVVRGRLARSLEAAAEYVPWEQSGRLVVRTVQLVIVVLTALSILIVWGQFQAAITAALLLSGGVPVVWNLVLTALLIGAAYVGTQLLEDAITEFVEQSARLTDHQEEIAFRVLELVVITGVALVALTIWGVDLGGLLIGAGFLGIVVGMAARQTLGSLIAGFVLMFSRPFEVGDWVQIGDEEGRITDITIVNTRLENPDGEFVSLPNDLVANQPIINRSRKGRLRLRVEVGIDYDADPETAKDAALDAIKELDSIMRVPQPQAVARRFDDSAIVLELRVWIEHPSPRRRARTIDEIVEVVNTAFDEAGIKIPFPQRELSGRAETGGFRVANEDA